MKEEPVPHRQARQDHPREESGSAAVASPGEQGDEFLARAMRDALVEGMSWAQIGGRLGVRPPTPCGGRAPTDLDWQEAIIAHENARAGRIHAENTHSERYPPLKG